MTPDINLLFEPLTVNGIVLRNRIVMPPMVTNRFIGGPDGRQWYAEHAAGVGLVIVEATAIDRFDKDLTRANLTALTNAIHHAGAIAAIQLFPVTFGSPMKPADLSPAQIRKIVAQYRAAAKLCAQSGFDGVEPHGAHGFLLNQFFSPTENSRKDLYGGSLENRMRLGLEIVRACRKALGKRHLLLYRHTPLAWRRRPPPVDELSYTIEDSLHFARELVRAGVDILDISPASDKAPADRAAPFMGLGVPVIAVNLMDEVDRAVEALREKRCDLIAIARGLIADPQWPQKVRDGRLQDIVKCTRCDKLCFGNLGRGQVVACTQWSRR